MLLLPKQIIFTDGLDKKVPLATVIMLKTTYHLSGMDCPSEERIIRLKLDGETGLEQLRFDLENRKLEALHHAGTELSILKSLETLNMGVRLIETSQSNDELTTNVESHETRILWIVLAINFAFFLLEMAAGLFSGSMGLVADSLDMLADAFVYAMALLAVGAAIVIKKRVAKISGYLQLFLAALGYTEVIRRFLSAVDIPDFQTMMIISTLALIANLFCLWILQRAKSNEAHIQASIIFTSNDVIINLGIIFAGVLVWYLKSQVPDLIIGSIVFVIVIRGAIRILNISR